MLEICAILKGMMGHDPVCPCHLIQTNAQGITNSPGRRVMHHLQQEAQKAHYLCVKKTSCLSVSQ